MRRRAVLVVEYTVNPRTDGHVVVPTAEKWQRVFGGSGVEKLHIEIEEDKPCL